MYGMCMKKCNIRKDGLPIPDNRINCYCELCHGPMCNRELLISGVSPRSGVRWTSVLLTGFLLYISLWWERPDRVPTPVIPVVALPMSNVRQCPARLRETSAVCAVCCELWSRELKGVELISWTCIVSPSPYTVHQIWGDWVSNSVADNGAVWRCVIWQYADFQFLQRSLWSPLPFIFVS